MSGAVDHRHRHGPGRDAAEDSVGALVTQASQQISQLVRQELRLAQAEMAYKGKRFGRGGGLFGGAATLGFVALQASAAAAIAALALVLPLWASALIVTGGLLLMAAVFAAVGKAQLGRAGPPAPERTIRSVKADVAEIRERAHR